MSNRNGDIVRSPWLAARWMKSAVVSRPTACLSRLWRDSSAITSLEYAVVGFPFFALIFCTMTLGLWYFCVGAVDLAVYQSARAFLTGQLQSTTNATSMLTTDFTTDFVCPAMPGFLPCSTTNPVVSIDVVADFHTLVHQINPSCTVADQTAGTCYPYYALNQLTSHMCSPAEGDVVYIQVTYTMPGIFGFFGIKNAQLLSGTTVQVEQFPADGTYATNC